MRMCKNWVGGDRFNPCPEFTVYPDCHTCKNIDEYPKCGESVYLIHPTVKKE